MRKFLSVLNDAKYIITTILLIITSIIGSFKLMSDYFVTKAYAVTKITGIESKLTQVQHLSKTNTVLIYQLRLSKFEHKMEGNKKLTPGEKRQYEILKRQLEKLSINNY